MPYDFAAHREHVIEHDAALDCDVPDPEFERRFNLVHS